MTFGKRRGSNSPSFSFKLLIMKRTTIMLAVVATFFITWSAIAFFGYLLSDISFKECMQHMATIMCMMMVGWIPSCIVGMDLEERLES